MIWNIFSLTKSYSIHPCIYLFAGINDYEGEKMLMEQTKKRTWGCSGGTATNSGLILLPMMLGVVFSALRYMESFSAMFLLINCKQLFKERVNFLTVGPKVIHERCCLSKHGPIYQSPSLIKLSMTLQRQLAIPLHGPLFPQYWCWLSSSY
jgi:hypothetical protein